MALLLQKTRILIQAWRFAALENMDVHFKEWCVYTYDEWTPMMSGHLWWVDTYDEWAPVMSGHLWWVDTCDEWTPVMSGHLWCVGTYEEWTPTISGHQYLVHLMSFTDKFYCIFYLKRWAKCWLLTFPDDLTPLMRLAMTMIHARIRHNTSCQCIVPMSSMPLALLTPQTLLLEFSN